MSQTPPKPLDYARTEPVAQRLRRANPISSDARSPVTALADTFRTFAVAALLVCLLALPFAGFQAFVGAILCMILAVMAVRIDPAGARWFNLYLTLAIVIGLIGAVVLAGLQAGATR